MKNIKTDLKNIFKTIVILLLSLLLLSTLYYFNILKTPSVKYIRIILFLGILFISSYNLGKKKDKHGFLEGLKLGGIIVLISTISMLLFFKDEFNIKIILYYIIILFNTMLGSMIGISKKKG